MIMKELKRHLLAAVIMACGGYLILAVVVGMNDDKPTAPPAEKQAEVAFDVEKKKPPPRKREQPQRQNKQVKASNAPRAPMPELASAIGGVDFQLPGFESASFSDLNDKLLGDTSKQATMTADAVDDPPKPRTRVPPSYPDKARQRGITGYVTLKLKVTSNGSVDSVRVVEASPRGIYEESAFASIKQWDFAPAVYQGNPVDIWINQTLRYVLN
jgi:protein TonB